MRGTYTTQKNSDHHVETRSGKWIMNHLWKPTKRCIINIPDTVTTHDNGEWDMWLFTARTGEVLKRRQIDVDSLTRRFLFQDDESEITEDQTSCAIARFRDGRSQIMNRKEFRRMVKRQRERSGMEAIQMLMSSSKRTSSYRNEYQVANETGRVIRSTKKLIHWKQSQGTSTLKTGASSSVRCANKRLCAQFNELTNQLVKSIENGTRCRVVHLVAEYTVDEDERIWFLWCDTMSFIRGNSHHQRVENLGKTSPARMMRDRRDEDEEEKGEEEGDDVDTFVKQLTTARRLIQPDEIRSKEKQKKKKKKKRSSNGEDDRLTLIAGSSKTGKGDHKMPTPFACKGDFCNFAVHEPKVLTATEMFDQRTRFAKKLLSKDEFRHFEQQSAYLSRDTSDHHHRRHHEEQQLCKITFRSIQLAREERRGVDSEMKSSNQPRYMKSTEARSRQSHSSHSQLSRAYEDVYVCGTCREVYKILDEARHLSERSGISNKNKVKKSKGKTLLDDTLSLLRSQRRKKDQQQEDQKRDEFDTFGDLDDYLRGGSKLRKSLYSDGLRSSDGFSGRRRSRKKSAIGMLPIFGNKKKSIVSPLGSMSITYRHNRNRDFDDIMTDSQLFSADVEVESKPLEKEKKQKEKDQNELSRIVGRTHKRSSPQRKERYLANILLGEASDDIRDETRKILEDSQYVVTCADNGQSVIEISKSKDFDLILIARELPTIDGLATTKIFRQREARRKRKRRTPVIVFTDMLTQDDLRLYQDIGMDGCIPKPVDRKSLLDTITQAVPKHYAGPPLSPRTKVKMKQPGIDHSAITVTSRHAKTLVDLHNANETNSPIVGIDKNLKKKSSSPRRTKTTAMSTFERTRRAERKKKKGTESKDIESGTYTHNPDTELAYSVLKFGDCPKDVPLFHFVVIHDFFDSMETMRIFFKPLVRKFQGLRVLVFNLPGQAYTKWSRKQLLNNKFYAEVLQGLLQHVDGTGQFPTTRTLEHGGKEFVPYYLLGFGNGACTALYYSIHMHDPSMRALLMLNGFSHVDERLAAVLHDCVNVFSLCPKTRPDLPVYFYTRFLFSKKFLSKVSSAMALNMYTAVHNPIQLEGRIQICHGALAHVDLRSEVQDLRVPMIVVQSESDELVNPNHVRSFTQGKGEATSIHKCLKRRKRTCVIRLDSGHEVFMEARKSVTTLIERLASGLYENHDVPIHVMDIGMKIEKKETLGVLPGMEGLEHVTGLQVDDHENDVKKKKSTKNEKPLDTKMEDNYIDNVLDEFGHTEAERTAERLSQKRLAQQTVKERNTAYMHVNSVSRKTYGGREISSTLSPTKTKKKTGNHGGKTKKGNDFNPEHPSFERRAANNTVYKAVEGGRVHPLPSEVPEMKEYMSWRLARNRKRLNFLNAATNTIIRAYRSWCARTLVQRMRRQRSALFCQRVFRGWRGRRRAKERRKMIWASKIVQLNWRGKIGRDIFERKKKERWAALLLQRCYRGHLGYKTTDAIRKTRNSNATVVQAWWRGRMGRKYGWLARTKRNASIDIERVWRGYLGRQRAQAERDKYLFSKSQSVGIEFGRQMLMEHKMHATKLQSEIALLLKQKADTEEEVEKLLYEVSGFETNVSHLENEMHELSKVEVETEARLTEKQRVEIRESKVRLDKEFGLMLQKIARHRETLKTKETLLQQIDRSKKLKSNELRDLERKLVVLLEEQQQSLSEIKQRQQKMNSRMIEDYPVVKGSNKAIVLKNGSNNITTSSSSSSSSAVASNTNDGHWKGPTPAQKQQAVNLMQSTETLMKFGFMSMSLTYFSSLNMIKAVKSVGAMDTVLAAAQAHKAHYSGSGGGNKTAIQENTGGDFRRSLKPGEVSRGATLDVANWSIDDCGKWLETLCLGQYRECFQDATIDGSFLYDLNDEDLRNTLGIEHKLHRKKILNSIKRLKKQEKIEQQQIAASSKSSSTRRKRGAARSSSNNNSTAIVPATIDEISSDEDDDDARDTKTSKGKAMLLDLDELFSWIRHRHTDKIIQAFENFPDEEFTKDNIKYQYIEDIGTQYTDEYNFNRHINITDNKGNTMLLVAAQNGALNIAKFLVKKSANPNHQNAQGQTALHYAMAYDFFEFGSWLTSEDGAKADDSILNMYDLTPYDGLNPE